MTLLKGEKSEKLDYPLGIKFMTLPEQLESERLILRRWKKSDIKPFAILNSDPKVMEFFPRILSEPETGNLVVFIEECFEKHDLGLWAVDRKDTKEFIGFVGLWIPTFKADFTPCVEIGWRLLYEHWGKGFAPEAAMVSLEDGFSRLNLDEIVSFTTKANKKSIRVMEKIGLSFKDEFEHPSLPEDHVLRPHVIYSITRDRWLNTK